MGSMGLFQSRPEEIETEWAGLPAEPRENDGTEVLDTVPGVDPMSLDFGGSISSIVFPVAPPAPGASSSEDGEPEDPSAATAAD